MEDPEPYNQEPEQEPEQEDNQNEEEDVKIFDNKYDNEFIGLLNEIGIRLPNFSKHDKLKIKSWINLLTMPFDTNETKKNRNLYGIKLINQMINGKLEEPFIRHANGINDLKWLSPIDIKAELTKKFYEEIDFEKIENYGIQQQKNFLNNNPDIANKIRSQTNNNLRTNFTDNNNYMINNNYNDNYYDDMNNNINERNYYTDANNYNPMGYRQMPIQQRANRTMNNKKSGFTMTNNRIKNNKNYNDKIKLINIIRDLEQKVIERDEIIEFQNKQIEQIKNRIIFIQNLQNNNNNNQNNEQ
jgi:hypothetical protein